MTAGRRALLLATIIATVMAAGMLARRLVNVEAFRPRLEAAASEALGMDVHVDGPMAIGYFPGFHVTAHDGRILTPRGDRVATIRRANVYFDLVPLLLRRYRLHRLELVRPAITVPCDSGGVPGSASLPNPGELLSALGGAELRVTGGSIACAGDSSGSGFAASGIDLFVRSKRLEAGAGAAPAPWSGALRDARVSCDSIRANGLLASAFRVRIQGKGDVVDAGPFRMDLFGGNLQGTLRTDLTGAVPRYDLLLSLPKFRIERFLDAVSAGDAGSGTMSFTAAVSMEGTTTKELIRSSRAKCSLDGTSLTLRGVDLDRSISRFESSQHFNIIDVGAVFLVGPLGLAVTRGYDFAKLFLGSGEKTEIGKFVSDWNVERGVASALDVAMTTPRNRIALQGALDFVNSRYDDLTVAVVDEHGCATLRQTIHGPFEKPEVDKPSVLSTLAGPVVKLVKTAKNVLPSGPCEPFYTGSVAPVGR